MLVLVACEFSGIVREAFGVRGHDVVSCDLLPATMPTTATTAHYVGDVQDIINEPWDLIIAHPPCTYLAVSGARWFKTRMQEQSDAVEFFMRFARHRCPRVAIENPIGVMSRLWRKPDQIVQPWMFGHGETKATCLWLKGLPLLMTTDIVSGRVPRVHYESPGVVDGMTRQQRRSITLQGIAEAMAEQWR